MVLIWPRVPFSIRGCPRGWCCAEHVVELWRDDWAPTETEYRTLAPLDNLIAWGEPVVIEDGFVIRAD
jgi:hypothetical protein